MPDTNTPTNDQVTKIISLDNLETYTTYVERKGIDITYAEYQQLTPAEKVGKTFYITDYPDSVIDASKVSYDNTDSGLESDDVQDAIDELKDLIDQGGGGGTDTTYTLSVGTGADASKIVLTDSDGNEDKVTVPYATNAGTVDSKMAGNAIAYYECSTPNTEINITGAGHVVENTVKAENNTDLYMIRFTADAEATQTTRTFNYAQNYPVLIVRRDLPINYSDGSDFTRVIHDGDYIIIKLVYDSNIMTGGVIVADHDSNILKGESKTVDYASVITVNDAMPVNGDSITVKIEPVQAGSGDPSPSNVRPISGWNNVEITRAGKNLIPLTLAAIKAANVSASWNGNKATINGVEFEVLMNDNGEIIGVKANGTASADWTNIRMPNMTLKSGTYILNGITGGAASTYRVSVINESGTNEQISYDGDSSISIANESNQYYYRIVIRSAGYTANNLIFYPMVRAASITDAVFEPYKSNSYTISLDGTRYGGTLHVDKFGNAELYIDKAYKQLLSTDSWNKSSSGYNAFYIRMTDVSPARKSGGSCISNIAVTDSGDGYLSKPWCLTKDASLGMSTDSSVIGGTEITNWQSYLTNNVVQVCYELANPFTVSLSPAQIQLLKGQNTIYADSGDIKLTYETGLEDAVETAQATANNVGEAVEELQSGLFNNLGETVDLTNRTAGDLYTFSSDGYLNIYNAENSLICRLYGATGDKYIYIQTSTPNESQTIYVRKGMRVDVRANTGSSNTIGFKPLVS